MESIPATAVESKGRAGAGDAVFQLARGLIRGDLPRFVLVI